MTQPTSPIPPDPTDGARQRRVYGPGYVAVVALLSMALAVVATWSLWALASRTEANTSNWERWFAYRLKAERVADVLCDGELVDSRSASNNGEIDWGQFYEGRCEGSVTAQVVAVRLDPDGASEWHPVVDPVAGDGVWRATFIGDGVQLDVRGTDGSTDSTSTITIDVGPLSPTLGRFLRDDAVPEGTDRSDGIVDPAGSLE